MNPTRVSNNLSVIEEHIAREATDVEKAIELYTDDIVWESLSRNLILQGKKALADNYRRMFSSIKDIEIRSVERFASGNRQGRLPIRRRHWARAVRKENMIVAQLDRYMLALVRPGGIVALYEADWLG
jgi:hypothetical protein